MIYFVFDARLHCNGIPKVPPGAPVLGIITRTSIATSLSLAFSTASDCARKRADQHYANFFSNLTNEPIRDCLLEPLKSTESRYPAYFVGTTSEWVRCDGRPGHNYLRLHPELTRMT